MRKRLAKLLTAGAVATLTVVSAACSPDESSSTTEPAVAATIVPNADVPGAVGVVVRNYAFEPTSVAVGSGESALWTVVEGTHEIVATDGAQFDSGPVDAGSTFTWSPDVAGSRTVSYKCKLHPTQMNGTIQVSG